MIYPPAEDSLLLSRNLVHYVKSRSFLDMGAGSGVQAETALKEGASSVLAIDIDSKVVEHLSKKHIKALESDLFSNVKGTFDVIAFNPPYLPLDKREDQESQRVTTGGKRGDEIIVRFLTQAPAHLASKGIILLLVSSLTPQKKIDALLKKLKLKKKIIDSEKLFMEKLELWELAK